MATHEIKVGFDASGRDFKVLSDGFRSMRAFHVNVNVMALRNARLRLAGNIKGEIRSGNLIRSLQFGGEDNISRAGEHFGELGTSLPYAAKVNEGGMIFPQPPTKALAVPASDHVRRNRIWPRDYDPGRQKLVLVFRTGKPGAAPLLFDPDNPEFAWTLHRSVDWGPGYRYLEWREEDIKEIAELYWDHVGLGS